MDVILVDFSHYYSVDIDNGSRHLSETLLTAWNVHSQTDSMCIFTGNINDDLYLKISSAPYNKWTFIAIFVDILFIYYQYSIVLILLVWA